MKTEKQPSEKELKRNLGEAYMNYVNEIKRKKAIAIAMQRV